MWVRRAALVPALLLLISTAAVAHPAPFSYIDVRPGPRHVAVTLVMHAFDVGHELGLVPERVLDDEILSRYRVQIVALAERGLQLEADGERLQAMWSSAQPLHDRQSLKLHAVYGVKALPGTLTLTASLFPYDPRHQTFVNVYEDDAPVMQSILDREQRHVEHFAETRHGRLALIRKLTAAGLHHIMIGPDHLLFLVALLLSGGSLRTLALIVSAFTVAHSVTLSLAATGTVSPPPHVVEPAIALSIVVVGVDNLFAGQGRDLRALMALGFGLLHGFGFAGPLREMGIEGSALAWSLFAFNLGVEIGQLAVVAGVAALLAVLRARSEAAGRRLAFAGSVGVIGAGTFWFIQRLFFAGGMA